LDPFLVKCHSLVVIHGVPNGTAHVIW